MERTSHVVRIFLLFFLQLVSVTCDNSSHGHLGHQKRLMKKLFEGYDISVRPAEQFDKSVTATLSFRFRQLLEINEKLEYIRLAVWSQQQWRDPQLTWDPSEYGGITSMNILPEKVWVPDTTLYNSVQEDVGFGGSFAKLQTPISVSSNGGMFWLAPIILTATCKIKIKHFPFDTQHCWLKFGSWTYPMAKLDMRGTQLDVTYYEIHQEWSLANHTMIRTEIEYTCCPGDIYPDVTFHMYFRRRSLFYVVNLVFPIGLITLLTIMTFILPASAGERLAVAVTLFLDITVFLLVVNDMIPQSSDDVCLVSIFFVICIVLMFFMLVVLFLISRLHLRGRGTRPMPVWMRKYVFDRLSYFFRIRYDAEMLEVNRYVNEAKDERKEALEIAQRVMTGGDVKEIRQIGEGVGGAANGRLPETVRRMITSRITGGHAPVPSDYTFEEEWNLVAATFDQLFFYLFLIGFIVAVFACFGGVTYAH